MSYKDSLAEIKQAEQPVLMGIVNVTPDSFSDGGKHNTAKLAIAHAKQLIMQGAAIVDIGGESTRPGAKPVDLATELKRVLPVVEALRKNTKALISIDTTKPEVAAIALRYGADIVNDVSGLRNSLMRDVVAREQCLAIIMHPGFALTNKAAPGTVLSHITDTHKQKDATKNIVKDVYSFFEQRIEDCVVSGIKKSQLVLDPGIGFGKNTAQNLELLHNVSRFKPLRLPILIGASRKRFIGELAVGNGRDRSLPPHMRLPGTLAAHAIAVEQGATILRVHDVAEHRQFFHMF